MCASPKPQCFSLLTVHTLTSWRCFSEQNAKAHDSCPTQLSSAPFSAKAFHALFTYSSQISVQFDSYERTLITEQQACCSQTDNQRAIRGNNQPPALFSSHPKRSTSFWSCISFNARWLEALFLAAEKVGRGQALISLIPSLSWEKKTEKRRRFPEHSPLCDSSAATKDAGKWLKGWTEMKVAVESSRIFAFSPIRGVYVWGGVRGRGECKGFVFRIGRC